MKTLLLFAMAVILNGCTTLSEKAMKIQVHSQVSNLLTDCKKIGPVDGTASSMLSPEQAISEAKAIMREKTADLGGDTVAILNNDVTTSVTSWTASAQGIAFTCYR
jgi:starvation-inducible outer membrane lipoprotein